MKQERLGEIFIILSSALYGAFPVITSYAGKHMPPLFFAGSSLIVAACIFLIANIFSGAFKHVNWRAIRLDITMITLFIIILPFIFIFIGASKTSSINTSMLLQIEILVALVVYRLFIHEPITQQKLIGGVMLFVGSILAVYDGSQFSMGTGDILVIIGACMFPIGNIFSKRITQKTTAGVVVFIRSLLGGMFLLFISSLVEYTYGKEYPINGWHFVLILVNGFLVHGIAKMLWYDGLKRLDIGKATALAVATVPVFNLLYSYLFLREVPVWNQWFGFLAIFIGILIITWRTRPVAQNLIEPQ